MLLFYIIFLQDITLARLGFPEATVDESTVWIGSKGAHTPCHIDTYGINLVCQLYGRYVNSIK